MSDQSTAPADLSNMGIDLSQIFRPAWTMEEQQSPDAIARIVAHFDKNDAMHRAHKGAPNHGTENNYGKKNRPLNNLRKTGRDRQLEGIAHSKKQRENKEDSPRSRNRQRGRHHSSNTRHCNPEMANLQAGSPILQGWELQILPKITAIEAIAKQVRTRAKAYPLFELARLIIHLSERYDVRLQARDDERSSELFRVNIDGSLWQSRKDAVEHIFSKHLDKFYHRSTIKTEAPKGAFTVVAQCGMSNILLGPPNHHEYTAKIISLHAARFKNVPFEIYKSRIRMMRDANLIEEWKSEYSQKTVFTPIDLQTAKDILPIVDLSESQPTPSELLPVSAQDQSSADHASLEQSASPIQEDVKFEDSKPITASGDQAISESIILEKPLPIPQSPVVALSLAEATAHFNEHYAAHAIEPCGSEITIDGSIALHGSTPLLRELLLNNLREMDRFPLPLAQVLLKKLTERGLYLFKSQRKIIHVSVTAPRYLNRETTPIGQNFCTIIDYIESHPKQPRDKQWAGLLACYPSPVSIGSEESILSEEEELKRREHALASDLLCLLHQGHIIDFAMGNLQVATRPASQLISEKKHPSPPYGENASQNISLDSTQIPSCLNSSSEIIPEENLGN